MTDIGLLWLLCAFLALASVALAVENTLLRRERITRAEWREIMAENEQLKGELAEAEGHSNQCLHNINTIADLRLLLDRMETFAAQLVAENERLAGRITSLGKSAEEALKGPGHSGATWSEHPLVKALGEIEKEGK